jgi:protein TonB
MKNKTDTLSLWIFSIGFAIFFNLLLFSFMAMLVKKRVEIENAAEFVESVNFIRIKKTLPHKEKIKKQQPTKKPKQIKLIKKVDMLAAVHKKVELNIPFELNPKLPPLSGIPILNITPNLTPIPHIKSTFSIGELDSPLIPIVKFPPIYPLYARRVGIEGWVKVRFIVNENGKVSHIKIIKSQPKDVFDQATIKAISRWRFSPPTVDGIPVRVQVETTIKFKLK